MELSAPGVVHSKEIPFKKHYGPKLPRFQIPDQLHMITWSSCPCCSWAVTTEWWMGFGATWTSARCPCPGQGVGVASSLRSLPNPTILWLPGDWNKPKSRCGSNIDGNLSFSCYICQIKSLYWELKLRTSSQTRRQSHSSQHNSMAAELRDPQGHSAALASSWRVLLDHQPAGQQGQQALESVSTQALGDHAPSSNPSPGTNLVLESSPVPKCSTRANLGLFKWRFIITAKNYGVKSCLCFYILQWN